MTRTSHALCAMYTLTAMWLAWCTLASIDRTPLWVTLLFGAASIVPVIAITETTYNAHDMRGMRTQLARAVRPAAAAPPPAPDEQVMNPAERAAFDEIASNYRKDDAA